MPFQGVLRTGGSNASSKDLPPDSAPDCRSRLRSPFLLDWRHDKNDVSQIFACIVKPRRVLLTEEMVRTVIPGSYRFRYQ